jgi:hypothetical protein
MNDELRSAGAGGYGDKSESQVEMGGAEKSAPKAFGVLPGLSFCQSIRRAANREAQAGLPRHSRLVRQSRSGDGGCGEGGSNCVKPVISVKMPGKYMQIPYSELLAQESAFNRVSTCSGLFRPVPACSDLFRPVPTCSDQKNKS